VCTKLCTVTVSSRASIRKMNMNHAMRHCGYARSKRVKAAIWTARSIVSASQNLPDRSSPLHCRKTTQSKAHVHENNPSHRAAIDMPVLIDTITAAQIISRASTAIPKSFNPSNAKLPNRVTRVLPLAGLVTFIGKLMAAKLYRGQVVDVNRR
jgi:hypothetical protein